MFQGNYLLRGIKQQPKPRTKNAIRDRGCNALYAAAYPVDTAYTVDMVYTVDTAYPGDMVHTVDRRWMDETDGSHPLEY